MLLHNSAGKTGGGEGGGKRGGEQGFPTGIRGLLECLGSRERRARGPLNGFG